MPNELTKIIKQHSDWTMIPVKGLLDSLEFYKMVASGKFPVTTHLRPLEKLEYYDDVNPDLFHEYFGHYPYLFDKEYSKYICKFSSIALKCDQKWINYFDRLFWHIFEFGLVKEKNEIKAFGAGIIPSKAEMIRAQNSYYHQKFNPKRILHKHYQVNKLQNEYSLFESIEQIYEFIEKDMEILIYEYAG